ncbi:hypothetical protein C367_03062 [Cryptococcus neoformans Ze90-1]|nr:hypothetical protein C367_03062 [Cryptococcus neoformans var. grubii Ze90-1]
MESACKSEKSDNGKGWNLDRKTIWIAEIAIFD